MKVFRWAIPALLLATAAGVAVYRGRPAPPQPVYFSDDLKGPSSEHLVIPFEAFTLTPDGLLRSHAVTAHAFGNDRAVVRTRSGGYLAGDFVFEVDVTVPPDTEDLAYVGFGSGASNPAYNNEPAGAFMFRIHSMKGMDVVHAAASRPPSDRKAEAGPQVFVRLETIGRYAAGTTTTFRIEQADNRVTLSIPGQQGASYTFALPSFPGLFDREAGYLFFGNSAEGTVFGNVRVRPRG